MQASIDTLKEAKLILEKPTHEKDLVVASLESERSKVDTLTHEKHLAFQEKHLALKEKELALEEKQKALEEKQKALEERQKVLEEREHLKA